MIQVLVPSPALDITYLIDEFHLGAIHRPASAIHLAGGKGINLARAGLRVGLSVDVVTALGGHTGARVAELARAEGIRLRDLGSTEETRLCVSIVGEQTTEIYEHPPLVDTSRLAAIATDAPLVVSGRTTGDLSGIIDRVTAVDTSGPALKLFIDAAVPLVKVNRAEAAETLGSDAPALELARTIHARGVALVVVTDGAAGSVAVGADGEWIASSDPEPGGFTVGSGDSYFAGLLAGLERHLPLPEALGLAAAAGSANTRQPGAGVFDHRDVASALARVRVEPA